MSYLRFPHVHGDLVTFVAEDDVWLAPLDGGRAWRVSADQVPVSHPRFSPDGRHLAWTSYRDGAPEVHVAATDGGPSRRLTHWGDEYTGVRGWADAEAVLAVTATGEASLRRTWAHAVPLDGGPARRLPFGPVDDVAFGPDGAVLLGSVVMREPAHWKRYRGGTVGKLWLGSLGNGAEPPEFRRILADLPGNLASPMWVGGRIAFLSDHEGVANLYSCLPDGSDLRRHTAHTEFYARHASTDGHRVVYVHAGELWLLPDLDSEPHRLDVRLGGPRPGRQPRPVSPGEFLESFAPDHTGRASAVVVRGTVHWVTHREGPARALAAEPGVRARLARVLPAPEDQPDAVDRVVWVTDADGEDAVEVAPATGVAADGESRRLGRGELGRVLELVAAPDGHTVALATHDGRLLLLDVDTGELRRVVTSEHGDVQGLAFSPDSSWVAWSHPGPEPLRHIRMARVADLSVVDVTPLRFIDYDPVFTRDGKHLAFLSVRDFDPVYDVHVFEVSFPSGARPFLVPLGARTPSPFEPELEGRAPGGNGAASAGAKAGAEKKDGDKDEDGRTPIQVDVQGLAQRIVPFPVAAGRYSGLRATQNGVLWLREPLTGALGSGGSPGAEPQRPALEFYNLAKRRCEVLVEGVDEVEVSGDGSQVVLRDRKRLRVQPAERKVDASSEEAHDIDLDRVRLVVDPAAEWRQAYAETGRLMRDHFWRADMGGVDWDGVLRRYEPLLDRISSHDDFVDLLWEVQGELATSHAYVTPRAENGDAARHQGLLGADLRRDEDGTWRVARVLPAETSDPQAHSPLAAPGVDVREGDAILAVNGYPVDPVTGPAPLLAGTAGRPTELTVQPADAEEPRRVVVVPLASDRALRYHDWVASRRAYVHEISEGRVGYLHVPDMVATGWAQLHRDLRVELQREALVVDVRENRGGHLSQLVVEKLARRVVGWQWGRGYQPMSYPLHAPRGPVVAVANEFSGSDGDIVNAAIKALGIGPVVGVRTWGGVVGIDMRYRLVDGTLVTQPRYATWMRGFEWGVENHGVDPDVEVVMAPQDWAAGRDPQVEKAVQLALEALAEQPAVSPPPFPA